MFRITQPRGPKAINEMRVLIKRPSSPWRWYRNNTNAIVTMRRGPRNRISRDTSPLFPLATTWPGLKTNGSNNQFLCRQQRWSSEEREDLSWRGSNENRVMYGDSREKRDVVAFSNVARSTFPLSVRLSLILSVGSRRILISCLGIP